MRGIYMMYMGGKSRIAKHIAYFINRLRRGRTFIEPFCGGCNVTTHVDNPRICSDIHYYLIKFWQAFQKGYDPPQFVSYSDYYNIQDNKTEYPPELVGYVGFGGFGGRWFKGYPNEEPERWASQYANVMKQRPLLEGVSFRWSAYDKLIIPDECLIYCDPPYADTQKYVNKFDTPRFWSWCRIQVELGHIVLVSEHVAPDDFISLWSKDHTSTLHNKAKRAVNKLFIHHSQRGLLC